MKRINYKLKIFISIIIVYIIAMISFFCLFMYAQNIDYRNNSINQINEFRTIVEEEVNKTLKDDVVDLNDDNEKSKKVLSNLRKRLALINPKCDIVVFGDNYKDTYNRSEREYEDILLIHDIKSMIILDKYKKDKIDELSINEDKYLLTVYISPYEGHVMGRYFVIYKKEINFYEIYRNSMKSAILIGLICLVFTVIVLRVLTKSIASEEANKIFFENCSHDLRTPLQIIKGYARNLYDGIETDIKKTSQSILKETDIMTNLVENILMISKIKSEATITNKIQYSNIELNDFLMDMITRFDQMSSEKRIIFTGSDDYIYINTDINLLNRLLQNLISNSIKNAREQIRIIVKYEKINDVDNVKIIILDDGKGFNDLENIHRFYTNNNYGFGIGLSVAFEICKLLKYNLIIKNENKSNTGGIYELSIKC